MPSGKVKEFAPPKYILKEEPRIIIKNNRL